MCLHQFLIKQNIYSRRVIHFGIRKKLKGDIQAPVLPYCCHAIWMNLIRACIIWCACLEFEWNEISVWNLMQLISFMSLMLGEKNRTKASVINDLRLIPQPSQFCPFSVFHSLFLVLFSQKRFNKNSFKFSALFLNILCWNRIPVTNTISTLLTAPEPLSTQLNPTLNPPLEHQSSHTHYLTPHEDHTV